MTWRPGTGNMGRGLEFNQKNHQRTRHENLGRNLSSGCNHRGCFFLMAGFRSEAAIITWTNTSGGNWSVANNWSPNQVPTNTDTALITTPGTYTVTFDLVNTSVVTNVANLTLGAGGGAGRRANLGDYGESAIYFHQSAGNQRRGARCAGLLPRLQPIHDDRERRGIAPCGQQDQLLIARDQWRCGHQHQRHFLLCRNDVWRTAAD